MRLIYLNALLSILFCLATVTAFGQQPSLLNIYFNEEDTYRDSVETSLEEVNRALSEAKLPLLAEDDELVTPNGTVWLSFEVPKPKKGDATKKKKRKGMRISVPYANQPQLLDLDDFMVADRLEGLTGTNISGLSFADNGTYNGTYYIPPDPSGAVGTSHVCHVVNTMIDCHDKSTGAQASGFPKALESFFTSLSPLNDGFDPKILWDQYENRFVVVHLEKATSPNVSRVFIAVSAGADPTGTWYFQAIDAAETIGGNECWFDYPGFAVDDEAVYITGNYFTFSGNSSCDQRLIIVDKGTSGGIYSGTTSADQDPSSNSAFSIIEPATTYNGTLQPAHTFGASPPDMFLLSYSALSGGSTSYIQYCRVSNPITSPSTICSITSMGSIESPTTAMPDAPQNGNATDIETNDRRTLNAVWQNDKLWTVYTAVPSTGSNSGQATAYWTRFNANASTFSHSYTDEIGGEDISTGLYTYMPSIAVNPSGNAAVSFSGSNSSTYAGAYAIGINGSTNAMTATQTIQAGVDDYVRTFGGTRNRYGDYTATRIDPSDGGFWSFNQAAITNGITFSGEDGQWQVFISEVEALDALLPVELMSFDVTATGNTAFLNWKTATEQNNYGFEVEHFIQNKFKSIGFVEGAGTTTESQSYSFEVEGLSAGTHLFRLRQVDYDGMAFLSDVQSIIIDKEITSIIPPYPNPFTSQTQLRITPLRTQKVLIQVFDINGRLITTINDELLNEREAYTYAFDSGNLDNGIYSLSIIGEDFSAFYKVVLNK